MDSGEFDRVLAECRAAPGLAPDAARALAAELRATAATPWDPDVEQPWCWADHPAAIRALGELAGGDAETELAAALVAICLEQFCVVREPLDAPTFAWLLARAPDAVDAALDTDLVIGGGRDELFHHLGRVPGEAGARWLLRLIEADDTTASDVFRGAARAWTPEDWNARLLALADARIAPRPTLLTFYDLVEPPREASPAQIRLALAYCDGALVLFTIRAFNFQVCRTWAGRDATGAVACVVTDLCLLEGVDPAAGPLPW